MVSILFIVPMIHIVQCYLLTTENIGNDIFSKSIFLIVTCFFAMIGITVNLRRFIKILQKPYHKSNFYIVLSCIFSTITFFALIYTLIYVVSPNSFKGINGSTPLDTCIGMIYFSIITFTTLGYGDIYPLVSIAKIFVSLETLSFFIFFWNIGNQP